ncbi:MAG: hypothetical protein ACHP8B_15230 [Terriglobales bacterium]
MITDPNRLPVGIQDSVDSLTPAQKEALLCAVAKIVALGAQAGVSPEQMIDLLKSGLTVGELLEFLAGGSGEVA